MQFNNLQIGTTLDIQFVNTEDDTDTVDYPEYLVLYIENNLSQNVSKMAGIFRIWFGHPWFIYKNTKNHAYE